jgi:DNA gyrase subunit B
MNEYLFELALSGVTIRNVRQDRPYTDLQAHQVIEWIGTMNDLFLDLQRRGIDAERLFKERFIQGIDTPLYRVKTEKGEYFSFEGERFGDDVVLGPPAAEQLDLLSKSKDEEIEVVIEDASDLPEIKEMKQILEKLGRKNVLPRDFFGTNGTEESEEPEVLFRIEQQKGDREDTASSTDGLIARILEIGKRGISVQRYKGLSEMNPEQLQQTTMDPVARTLIQIKLEDVVEADQMFTTLMGSKVQPRRDFIEKYALYVTNLDVYGS